MLKITINKAFNASKLYEELLSLNLITPIQKNGTSRLQGNELYLDDNSKIKEINAIIDAHYATPIAPQPSELDILRDYVLDMELRMILKELEM